ncbi:MAG: N-acetylmuramoyl-L-alanine amidase [Clostridia bacterium]|nr:N-acetylmuramoyl-L-alanine amidase [Clostridia bacterium]
MKAYRYLLRFSLLSLAVILAFSAASRLLFFFRLEAKHASVIPSLPTIILDAGHGGEDGGACGADGTPEKDLNLAITGMLADYFRMAGYTVVETRTEDRLLYDEGTPKGHKKQSDLRNRLAVAEQYPDGVLISIHMNSYPGVECQGLQVWYSKSRPESALYATAVQQNVKALLQPNNNRKIKAATSGIYLLNRATIPAILIECGFLSSPAECERLANDSYQRQLAFAIFTSLSQKIEEKACAETEVMV